MQKRFFQRNNPLSGFVKYPSDVKYYKQCEMPAGVGGFISFHFLLRQKNSQ